MQRLVGRSGEPVIRQALRQAMRILGRQFVLGQTIEEALAQRRGAKRAPATASPSTCWARRRGRQRMPSATTQRYTDAVAAIGGLGRTPFADRRRAHGAAPASR